MVKKSNPHLVGDIQNHSHYAKNICAETSALFNKSEKEEKWLSSKEASHFLKISPNALRILVCRGKVNFYKLGSRLRFRKKDLLDLLNFKGETV